MDDLISRQAAIDAVMEFMPSLTTPDGCGQFDREIFEAQEMFVDIGQALNELPTAQPEQQNARIFQGIIVEYPSISTYPEYEGKPYFSIKYTENGQDFIGYGTYKPDVLSEYLKKYFIPSAQPDSKELSFTHKALDTISRQAAINALTSHIMPHNNEDGTVTIGVLSKSSIKNILNKLPSAQPEHTNSCYTNSWCIDCKEYDTENKCCPRYNRVIKQTLDDAYRHGETEAEARFHAQQRWIPCSERLPDEEVLCCDTRGEMIIGYPYPDEESNTGFSAEFDDVFMIDCAAWMPLPEPYAERRTDEGPDR